MSTEISRELPAPLRVWLAKGRGAKPALYGWSALLGMGVVADLVKFLFGRSGMDGSTIFFLALPWGAYLLFRLYQTQRVLAAGYGLDDLRLAVRQHVEHRKEEVVFERSGGPSLVGRLIRLFTLGSVGVAVASGLAIALFPEAGSGWVWVSIFGGAAGSADSFAARRE